MKTIITKEFFLEKLKANRKQHTEIFEEAFENYTKLALELLNIALEHAQDGNVDLLALNQLQKPVNHLKDYDRAISMVENSQDGEFDLEENEYDQYIMDNWGWRRSFLVSNSTYSTLASGCLSLES